MGGPNFYGTGDNRELLIEYALSAADEQFRGLLKNGHCSALLGCGDARDAPPAMKYTENGVRTLAPESLVAMLSKPCVAMHATQRSDIVFVAYAWVEGLPEDSHGWPILPNTHTLVRLGGSPGSSGGYVRSGSVLSGAILREAEHRVARDLKLER